MLVGIILLFCITVSECRPHVLKHGHRHVARDGSSTILVSATARSTFSGYYGISLSSTATPYSDVACDVLNTSSYSAACPVSNNTACTSPDEEESYTVICNVDFVGQNIYPFVLANSFESCMAQCDAYNYRSHSGSDRCAGFVFAPSRLNDADDCYLKSSLNSAVPATLSLIGATLAPTSTTVPLTTASLSSSKYITNIFEMCHQT